MRQVKYRSWISSLQQFVYFENGNYSWIGKTDNVNVFNWDNAQQFTGLLDKEEVEIYEGDYLVDRYPIDDENLDAGHHESLLPVVWCDVKLQWCVDVSFAKDGSYLVSVIEYFGEHLEVKGNIYENPQP